MVSTRWERQEAKRRKKNRLNNRRWRLENPERVAAIRERQKKRQAANRLERKVTGHQKLHSFLLEKALTKKTILSCIHFIKQQFHSFEEKMVLPIKPMMNGVRLNFMTPQAIRMFFSENAGVSTINRGKGSNEGNDNSSNASASVHRFSTGAVG